MRHTFLPTLTALSLLAVGCNEGEEAAPATGVGRYGGDCRDGDESCTDEFGAKLCPVDDTGYEGDDLALCEPKNLKEGLLLHYGPEDYDDKKEVSKYTLEPFGEIEDCVYIRTPNKETLWINQFNGRMRPNSHHLIVTIAPELPEGVELGEPTDCDQGEALGARWLLGSQDPQIDLATQGSMPGAAPIKESDPEYGAGQKIEPNSLLRLNLHYVNTTDQEILREAWVFLKSVPEKEVEQVVDMITFFQGSIEVPPNTSGVETAIARCQAPEDRYVHMMTGHFHKNGTRFTIWHEPQGEEPYKVYETSDWDVPGNAFYTDRIDNPGFAEDGTWAADSGYLKVKKGDYINFQCEFDNPTDKTITFGELGADQMCNVFGMYYPSDGDVWDCACYGTLCI